MSSRSLPDGAPAGDPVAEELIRFLESEGARGRRHAGERSLLDHLVETYEILRRWNQPAPLQHAALIHSVYGTDVYRERSLALSRRGELRAIVGGTYALGDAGQAQRDLQERRSTGKLLLDPTV